MTLDLDAQLEAAQTAYLANLNFRSAASVAKAEAFEEACIALTMLLPQAMRQAGRFELTIDTTQIPKQEARVRAWLESQPGSSSAGRVRGFSVENFRD